MEEGTPRKMEEERSLKNETQYEEAKTQYLYKLQMEVH